LAGDGEIGEVAFVEGGDEEVDGVAGEGGAELACLAGAGSGGESVKVEKCRWLKHLEEKYHVSLQTCCRRGSGDARLNESPLNGLNA